MKLSRGCAWNPKSHRPSSYTTHMSIENKNSPMNNSSIRRVLVYRLGSIGDTVVALPSLHLIARSFPFAERRILTNFPVNGKAAPMDHVVGKSGLIQSYLMYPIGTRNIRCLWRLRSQIANWSPDVLVYLAKPRGQLKVFRDALFFYLCGIRKLIGVPYLPSQQKVRKLESDRMYESEAHRLLRCISSIGRIDVDDTVNWDLHLNPDELNEADQLLRTWEGKDSFITVGIGTKEINKDWGVENWHSVLGRISAQYPKLGMALIGSALDHEGSEYSAMKWAGPKVNLCGKTSPRVCAAVIGRSILYVGPDSGPMHLAAANRIPCVAIFSVQHRPGEWYPIGRHHSVICPNVVCGAATRTRLNGKQREKMMTNAVDEVFAAIIEKLQNVA